MSVLNPATNMTRTSDFTAPDQKPQQWYDKIMLAVLRQSIFLYDKFAQVRTVPKNPGTNTVNFRRIGKLQPATTPLTEGVTPEGKKASKSNVLGTFNQYGDFMAFSDRVSFEEIDPIIEEYTVELGMQAKETLDIIVRDVLANGTNVYYSSTQATRTSRDQLAAGDHFSLQDVRRIVRDFRKNHVMPVIDGDYACFIGPDAEYDIITDPEFKEPYEYNNDGSPLLRFEVGRAYGVRFYRVTNPPIFTSAGSDGSDVHAAIFIGKDAYGVVNINGEGNVKTYVKPAGSAGSEDPLNQRQTIGWKVNAFGAVRLNELALARYEFVPET